MVGSKISASFAVPVRKQHRARCAIRRKTPILKRSVERRHRRGIDHRPGCANVCAIFRGRTRQGRAGADGEGQQQAAAEACVGLPLSRESDPQRPRRPGVAVGIEPGAAAVTRYCSSVTFLRSACILHLEFAVRAPSAS